MGMGINGNNKMRIHDIGVTPIMTTTRRHVPSVVFWVQKIGVNMLSSPPWGWDVGPQKNCGYILITL